MGEYFDTAKEIGWIRPLEEAFEKYPPYEEFHHGDPFYVQEAIVKYNTYNIGDLVYVKYYNYENGNPGMNHLFVIIDKNIAVSTEYLAMILSSKIEKEKYKSNVPLKPNKNNHLSKKSIVKTDYHYVITNDQIVGKIGQVTKEDIELYKATRKKYYQEKND